MGTCCSAAARRPRPTGEFDRVLIALVINAAMFGVATGRLVRSSGIS